MTSVVKPTHTYTLAFIPRNIHRHIQTHTKKNSNYLNWWLFNETWWRSKLWIKLINTCQYRSTLILNRCRLLDLKYSSIIFQVLGLWNLILKRLVVMNKGAAWNGTKSSVLNKRLSVQLPWKTLCNLALGILITQGVIAFLIAEIPSSLSDWKQTSKP